MFRAGYGVGIAQAEFVRTCAVPGADDNPHFAPSKVQRMQRKSFGRCFGATMNKTRWSFQIHNWLVVLNMFFHTLGIVTPTDFHIFQRG